MADYVRSQIMVGFEVEATLSKEGTEITLDSGVCDESKS